MQSKNNTTVGGTTDNSTCSSPKELKLATDQLAADNKPIAKRNNYLTSRNEGTQNFAKDILMGLHDSEEGVYSSRECEGGNELCSSDDGGMPMDLPESSLLQKHFRACN